MTDSIIALRCVICEKTYGTDVLYTCPSCGPAGILDVVYDYAGIKDSFRPEQLTGRPRDIRRYAELLPIESPEKLPPVPVGWTPVLEAPRLAGAVGVARLFLKDDTRNPTASFKDRASAVGVAKAIEFGFSNIACASTGNAASSLAGMAAAAGLRATIFIPETAPEPKVTQLLVFGATVVRVRPKADEEGAAYEAAYDLCAQACQRYEWYNRSAAVNPYLVEGKKTAGLEIAEQMRRRMPDWVVVSVGDGCTIAGIAKGLAEMVRLGWIDRTPRLLGVQAEGAAPILKAFRQGGDLEPVAAHTIADSIAVGTPRNWRKALQAIRESKGTMVAVSDEEILQAQQMTARLGGVFGEPAGVAGVAGLKKAIETEQIEREATVLAVITGSGLKDIKSVARACPIPEAIEGELSVLERYLAEAGRW